MKPSQQAINKLFINLANKTKQLKFEEAKQVLTHFLNTYSDIPVNQIKNSTGTSLLLHLCDIGNSQLVDMLLEIPGIDINAELVLSNDELGTAASTVLLSVTARDSDGHRAISKALIKKGINLPKKHDPSLILLTAAANNHEEAIQFCINKKVNLELTRADIPGFSGGTALYLAAKYSYTNIVKLLLNAHADANTKTQNGFTALYTAIEKNHVAIVQLLVDAGADVNLTISNGDYPLLPACLKGRKEIVEILIQAKSNINSQNPAGFTPLYAAAQGNHLQVVEVLLKNNADPNLPESNNATPLMFAAEKGYLEVVKLLIAHKADLNAISQRTGGTALINACSSGRSEVVEFLLKQEGLKQIYPLGKTPLWCAAAYSKDVKTVETLLAFDKSIIDQTDDNGHSPINVAAMYGQVDIVQLLIKEGANFNEPNERGFTTLYYACCDNQIEIVKVLLQQDNIIINWPIKDYGANPINVAASLGFSEIVELLIEKIKVTKEPLLSADHALLFACQQDQKLQINDYLLSNGFSIHKADVSGMTPLIYAVTEQQKGAVIWALQNGADVNQGDKNDNTPLHYACTKGFLEIAKILLERGSDCSLFNKFDRTPLHMACEENQVQVCEWLLENKADMHAAAHDYTALVIACSAKNPDLIELLLKKNVNVNQQTVKSGNTALHILCLSGELALVKKLIDNKANINLANYNGETPLHIACERAILAYQVAIEKGEEIKHQVFIKTLLKLGADLQHNNSEGKTVLELALENKCKDLIKLLLEHNPQQTLQAACRDGKLAIVQLCIENNISIKIKNTDDSPAPIEIATQYGHSALVQLMLEKGAISSREDAFPLIHLACNYGKSRVMKLLIEKYRIRANELNKLIENKTKTLIYIASEKGFIDVVSYLLSLEVDVDKSSTKQMMTPLHIASFMGNKDLVTLLLTHKASADKTNSDRCMPIHLAYEQSQQKIVDQLLGVTKKRKALLIACRLGQKYLVQQLLKAGVKDTINKPDQQGKTLLHYVCESGNVTMAALLVEYGAKVNKTTESGLTPLYIACKGGHLNLVEYFIINTDVDINEPNVEDGDTPLACAAKQNNEEMLGLLMEHGADTSVLKKSETYISDGKQIPLHSLLFASNNKRDRHKTKAPKKSVEQTEELNRLGDIVYEELISVSSVSSMPRMQNQCTFGNGALSVNMDHAVKKVTHNGQLVPNIYFHIKKSVLEKVKASNTPDIFDPLLDAPQMNVFNGLKRLKNIHPDLWELKQQHSPARIYCFRFKSDSDEQGKQGSIIVTIAFSEKGAHTQGEIKAMIQSLKTNPEYKMFCGENTIQNSNNSNNSNNKGFF